MSGAFAGAMHLFACTIACTILILPMKVFVIIPAAGLGTRMALAVVGVAPLANSSRN